MGAVIKNKVRTTLTKGAGCHLCMVHCFKGGMRHTPLTKTIGILSSVLCFTANVEAKDFYRTPPNVKVFSEADLPGNRTSVIYDEGGPEVQKQRGEILHQDGKQLSPNPFNIPSAPPVNRGRQRRYRRASPRPFSGPTFSYRPSFYSPKVPYIKGVVLVGRLDEVSHTGISQVRGVELRGDNLCIPGPVPQLTRLLECIFRDKLFTQDTILALKREVILFYRTYHRPMVTVVIPEQDITSGVLQLVVIEGRVGDIIARGNCWFSDCHLESYIRLCEGDVITTDVLTSDITWMNRNPFRRTDIVFTPGDLEGSTDIELWTHDRFPLRPFVGGDNSGLDHTGRARWFGGFTYGNLWGLSHILTYQYTTSTDFHEFQAHYVDYTAPLNCWRHVLEIFGGYSRVRGHFHQFEMDSDGWALQASLRYNIPIMPIYHHFLHEFTWGFDFKRLNNALTFTGNPSQNSEVNLTQLVLGYEMVVEYPRHKTTIEIEGFWSPMQWVADQTDNAYNKIRAFAKTKYLYGRMALGHTHTLPCDFSIDLLIREQIADENLLPSEEYGVGGYNTVRGYEERTLNGDNALVTNLELRTPRVGLLKCFCPMTCLDDSLQLLAFFDYGYVTVHKKLPGQPNSRYVMGIGPGVRYALDRYLTVRCDVGFKLHKLSDDHKESRVHIGVVATY
jgi:hemolysin activation/secretion protein